ncbi:hypothetical protein F2P79_006154 [Pimephales promelas]|nr:hypothetical protein F2P79_006154 [Pimephales promelas]
MGNHPCTPTPATIDSIYRVAQDSGILPDVTLDGTVANLLSLNSSIALNLQYATIQQSLATDQLEALHTNLTSIFGKNTNVSYGGVGVVALALSFLLEALVSSIVGKMDGVTTDPFKKAFGSGNSSEIASIASAYLKLVSKTANNFEEMGEITELYDQNLKYALIELYESMTLDQQVNTYNIKQWINGAAIHLHMRIHGIRLASVPKGTAESLRLSYRTGLARVKHGWISDGLSSNIMTILIVFDGHDTAEDYQTLLEDHEHLMLKPLKPHDHAPTHTARLVTEGFDEDEMFRRLAHNTSRGLDSDSGIPESPPSIPDSTQLSLLTFTSLLLLRLLLPLCSHVTKSKSHNLCNPTIRANPFAEIVHQLYVRFRRIRYTSHPDVMCLSGIFMGYV